MRSLKECYEIAKKHHTYWTGDFRHREFMCLAATAACNCGELTLLEHTALTEDAMTLVKSFKKSNFSLMAALSSVHGKDFTDTDVKDFWDNYIDNLGSKDDEEDI